MLKLIPPVQLVLTLLLFFVLAGESVATCSFVNGAKKATLTITPGDKTRLPTENGDKSTSYLLGGGALASLFNVSGPFVRIVSCTAGETLIIGNSAYASDGSNYLNTNISGVYLNAQAQTAAAWQYPYQGREFTLSLPDEGKISAAFLTTGRNATSGSVIGHTILSGKFSEGGVVNGGLVMNITTSDGLDIIDIYIAPFTITVPTCTINDYDKTVELGTAYIQQMYSPGKFSEATDFSINMTCTSTSLSPTVTFTGEADNNYPTVLTTNTGDATGIGVQLLYGGKAITPGTAVSLGKITSTLTRDYNFQARMHRITSSLAAGSFELTTTFSIDYE